MNGGSTFLNLRNRLQQGGNDTCGPEALRWPSGLSFNWALDYFDRIASGNQQPALRVIDEAGGDEVLSFATLSRRSNQVAHFLTTHGVGPGDRVLIMLGNVIALWETMLATMKIGAVMIPATTLLQTHDLQDRLQRGQVKAIVTNASLAYRFAGLSGAPVRISLGGAPAGWIPFEASAAADSSHLASIGTGADDLLLLYFTSGTTAYPKLVAHTHTSYPVGHLSTLYWLGLKSGDVHLNLSAPGWAKHAWSCFFAPWTAEATILAYHYERFRARALLDQLVRCQVTTFCAPPTVWRMLIQEDLKCWQVQLREVTSAGEPLNSEVVERVRDAWGLSIRDGFGQTETTAQVGNPPGHAVHPGSMGRPLPGYSVVLRSADGTIGDEGEICLDLSVRPVGLMQCYLNDPEKSAEVMSDGFYHTGDVARRDADGYLTYVGRMDDIFKSSDYRISPFEIESVLIEHSGVAEAAVVPSPDPLRMTVPKAFIALAEGVPVDRATALSIFEHVWRRIPSYKRIRRLEFAELPKTISGKIRRVELREMERARGDQSQRRDGEFWEEDFPALKSEGPDPIIPESQLKGG